MTEPPKCPYCGKDAELVDSAVVHNRSHGNIWICYPCEAWVGVHQNDGLNRPLGRLANSELRKWKQAAHDAFDYLWQRKMERDGCTRGEARRTGYAWLAGQMGVDVGDCHIGMFDVDQCAKVVAVCSPENIRMLKLAKSAGLPHDTRGPDGEDGEPCRCWLERQDDVLVVVTVVDDRTPEICRTAAGTVVDRLGQEEENNADCNRC